METASGEMELFLRALEGFPQRSDGGFELSDLEYVSVELVLRFISHGNDTSDAHFVHLSRSLADIVQLEKRTTGSLDSQAEQQTTSKVTKMIEEYERALSRPRFGSISQQTDRLMWQLESFLTTTLLQTPTSPAVKAFFGHQVVSSMKHGSIIEKCLAGVGGESSEAQETTIASGCSHHEEVEIVGTGQALLVWKFRLEDTSPVDFSVVWKPRDGSADDVSDATAAVDPYSVEAMAWTQDETEGEQDKQITLQYSTQYTSSEQWIYGACLVPADSGVAVLEWTNADTASIMSKHLTFQVASISASDCANYADAIALRNLIKGSDNIDDSESLAWLETMLTVSTATGWPVEKGGSDADDDDIKFDDGDSNSGVTRKTQTKQSDLRVVELESKVLELEEELQAVQQELKGARSELEISSEIYKASLETITQLETKAAVPRQPSQRQTTSQRKASFDDIFKSDDEEEDDEEEEGDAFNMDSEDEAESEPVDAETNRLRGLVATFQEQCLWRSIETTESEKRGLLLELELARVDDQVKILTATLAEKDKELAELRSENQKLKAHKSLLVKEVKRLQPYSQVNLATLIHEAEEARMVQRSLQAQLNALMAGPPETEHPQS